MVVSGGLGEPSTTRLLSDRLATAVRNALDDPSSEVSVLELRDLARDITDALLTRVPSPALQTALDAVAGADGLVVVSPIFSASYSGLFKSFFDVLDPEALEGTPVLIAATGGTERHSLALDYALRPLFSYLHAVVAPTGVFAATADWGSPEPRPGSRAGSTRAAEAAGPSRRRQPRPVGSGPVHRSDTVRGPAVRTLHLIGPRGRKCPEMPHAVRAASAEQPISASSVARRGSESRAATPAADLYS